MIRLLVDYDSTPVYVRYDACGMHFSVLLLGVMERTGGEGRVYISDRERENRFSRPSQDFPAF